MNNNVQQFQNKQHGHGCLLLKSQCAVWVINLLLVLLQRYILNPVQITAPPLLALLPYPISFFKTAVSAIAYKQLKLAIWLFFTLLTCLFASTLINGLTNMTFIAVHDVHNSCKFDIDVHIQGALDRCAAHIKTDINVTNTI